MVVSFVLCYMSFFHLYNTRQIKKLIFFYDLSQILSLKMYWYSERQHFGSDRSENLAKLTSMTTKNACRNIINTRCDLFCLPYDLPL